MKKIMLFLFCIMLCASHSFAAELVFSPGAGFSAYTVHSLEVISGRTVEVSDKAATYTILAPSVGLDMHVIHETSGFTFSLIHNAAIPITLDKKGGFGDASMNVKGFMWDGQTLFGYTFGVKKPFSIHAGIGLGGALGYFHTHTNAEPLINLYHAWTPIALHLSFQYIFTKHFGIAIGLHDMVSFSGLVRSKAKLDDAGANDKVSGIVGLGNVFTARIAASFRF